MKIILNDGVYIKTDGTVDKKRYEIAKRLYKKLKDSHFICESIFLFSYWNIFLFFDFFLYFFREFYC